MKANDCAAERGSSCWPTSGYPPERLRARELMLSVALVLLSGCAASMTSAAAVTYLYETELPPDMSRSKPDLHTRIVSTEQAPIPPVKFGRWFIPSSWAVKLAERWADLPYVFDADGPEYCAALGVDRDRMLHASAAVRYRDPGDAKKTCPALMWKDDLFMVTLSSAHSHPTLKDHGERISAQDATLGSPRLVGTGSEAKIEMWNVAVQFFSGERLMGVDPETGREAPVPAQSLLFTRYNFAPHVFLWAPVVAGKDAGLIRDDRSNFVRVYKPAPNDGWEGVGNCWVDARDVQKAIAIQSSPPVQCDPADFWLK